MSRREELALWDGWEQMKGKNVAGSPGVRELLSVVRLQRLYLVLGTQI